MKTIQAIKLILEDSRQRIDRIVALTKKDYDAQVKAEVDKTIETLKKLYMLFPDIIPVSDTSNLTKEDIDVMLQTLKERVSKKYSARLLPTGNVLCDEICGHKIVTPAFSAWQGGTAKEGNFVISYSKSEENDAVAAMNYLIGNMLLALPIKRVHLNFIDLKGGAAGQLFTRNLDKTLFKAIFNEAAMNDLLDDLDKRREIILTDCGNLVEYNEENQVNLYPYEVVVLFDYPNERYNHVEQKLYAMFENGYRSGIYFVVLHDTGIKSGLRTKSLVEMTDCFTAIDLNTFAKTGVVSCFEDKLTRKEFFGYIEKSVKEADNIKPIKYDYQALSECPYEELECVMEIPVGQEPTGDQINVVMNDVDHFHTFILGKSGSGKSVFLHSLITGAMMKYKPEELQFYLLDFKDAGVEFNRYKDSKHVKALLVDNSDIEIALEILRDLNEQKKQRAKLIGKDGFTRIRDYNRLHPENRMPQIVLVVDECQALFNYNREDAASYNEITDILRDIAKTARNQGIHIVLATQTLKDTDLPAGIKEMITDNYLLKCSTSDSEKMIPGSSDKTCYLETGRVYYRFGKDSECIFQSYFTADPEVPSLMKMVNAKAAKNRSNGQFYFNGSQEYALDNAVLGKLDSEYYNVAALGLSMDLKQTTVGIPIRDDYAENIMFFGLKEENIHRTMMAALVSITQTSRSNGRNLKTYVIDFNRSKGATASTLTVLERLKKEGVVTVIKDNEEIGQLFYQIAKSVLDKTAEQTLLVILNQDKIYGIKEDFPIEGVEVTMSPTRPASTGKPLMVQSVFAQQPATGKTKDISTYRKALQVILENGPSVGVNTLLKVRTPKGLLGIDPNRNMITRMFKHFVIFKADQRFVYDLGLEDVSVDRLSDSEQRLRAIYYSAEDSECTKFIPFVCK